jgi:hypothetical protein
MTFNELSQSPASSLLNLLGRFLLAAVARPLVLDSVGKTTVIRLVVAVMHAAIHSFLLLAVLCRGRLGLFNSVQPINPFDIGTRNEVSIYVDRNLDRTVPHLVPNVS